MATITASSNSKADVQAAINSATYNDTVVIPTNPNPTVAWNTTALSVTKAIRLTGPGVTINGDVSAISDKRFRYIINCEPDATSRSNDYPFEFDNLTINMQDIKGQGGLRIGNTGNSALTQVKVHHNTFQGHKWPDGSTGSVDPVAVTFGKIVTNDNGAYNNFGVSYLNTFTNCSGCYQVYGKSSETWDSITHAYGSANYMYLEDDTVNGNSVYAFGGHGGLYVARFNNIHFTTASPNEFSVLFDSHGNQTGGIYANMGCELYRNTYTIDRSTHITDFRGGRVLFFDNTGTGVSLVNVEYNSNWQLREEFADDNTDSPTTNSQPQHLSDVYSINNRYNSAIVNPLETEDDEPKGTPNPPPGVLQENVTHWIEHATFNGTVGTGRGTLASRPVT